MRGPSTTSDPELLLLNEDDHLAVAQNIYRYDIVDVDIVVVESLHDDLKILYDDLDIVVVQEVLQGKPKKGAQMPVARVTEMSATSDQSFEDAINSAVSRATITLRNVESAWVKDMNVKIQDNRISGYKANVAITFVLEEGEQPA